MTIEHEAYFYRTLYAVILESPNGGQRINYFSVEDKARKDADILINNIEKSGKHGYKVIMSPLDYCHRRDRIMSENVITEDSEILYGGDSE